MRTSEASAVKLKAPLQGISERSELILHEFILRMTREDYTLTMLLNDLRILSLLSNIRQAVSGEALYIRFNQLEDAPLSTDNFSFYHAVASVYSSKNEGETIELDSYVKHKSFHIEFQPDYTRKIDHLYLAYQFASENRPDKETFAEMHTLLAKHFVSTNWLGKFRNQNMFVTTKDGRIEYIAPPLLR